jgi:predicted unusual protein kinase regulating ubiquinone biosynthesis (AarF/ABC1/UbiB family)
MIKRRFKTRPLARTSAFGAAVVKASLKYGLQSQGHLKAALELAQTMGELKGGLMKVGQMISMTDDLLLPPEVTELFRSLQKDAPPMSVEDLDSMLAVTFPKGTSSYFSSFDKNPFAQASIGQVHQARLKSGEQVVVKVQYPRIKQAVAADLKNLDRLDELLNRLFPQKPDIKTTLEELKEALLVECDYREERQNLVKARKIFSDEFPSVRVPRVFEELCSENALVMEKMVGSSFQWTLTASQAQRNHWGQLLYDLHNFSFYRHHFLHTDPQSGNYLFNDGEIILLDFGSCRSFNPSFVHDYTLLLESLESENFERYNTMMRSFGFFTQEDSLELVRKHFNILGELYTPYAKPGRFPLASANPFELIKPFLKEIQLKGRKAPQREFLLLDRTHLGLYTKLKGWSSEIDWVSSRERYRATSAP